MPTSDPPIKQYIFNPALGTTGKWTLNGKVVPDKQVMDDLELVTAGYAAQMQRLSEQLIDGTISLADWQAGMATNARQIHNIQGAIANGGWQSMTPANWAAIAAIIITQLAFLQQFAIQIQNGTQKLGANFLRRTRMYAGAARATFWQVRRGIARGRGFTEERRVLHPADHCPDCVEFAGEGWQPIGTLPRIGESVCRTNCHCTFEFR